MNIPSLSVLLPIYNAAPYLSAALESILAQTYDNFELIAIDDGSSDDSLKILRDFAARDARVKVIARGNLGLIETLNQGLSLANAPLIARMDADDIALPDRFMLQVAHFHEHPQCVIVGSGIRFIDEFGKSGQEAVYPRCTELISRLLSEGSMFAHPAVMMSREQVLRVGGYRGAFVHAEDYDLWLRLSEIGGMDNLPQVLLLYRQHADQISTRHAVSQALSSEVARAMARTRRVHGREPEWNSSITLNIPKFLDLPLNDEIKSAICLNLLPVFLRPSVMVDSKSNGDLRLLLVWLSTQNSDAFKDARCQAVVWSIASRKLAMGQICYASRCAWAVVRHAPIASGRCLLTKIITIMIRCFHRREQKG